MTTLLAFLVTLGILIVIHEFGHYTIARACGVRVLRFSVGFGPVIARRRGRHGTEWALSAIPLGGYVKMLDEREGEVAAADLPLAFNRKPVWQRMAIVAAGPLANFLLAILLYWVLYVHGVAVLKPILGEPPAGTPASAAGLAVEERVMSVNGEAVEDWQSLYWQVVKQGIGRDHLTLETEDRKGHIHRRNLELGDLDLGSAESDPLERLGLIRYFPSVPPVVGEVVAGSPAQQAGLRPGDRITAIEGRPIAAWEEMVRIVRDGPGKSLRISLDRGGQMLEIRATAEAVRDQAGPIGRLGIAPRVDQAEIQALYAEVRFGPVAAMQRALYKTWDLSAFSLQMLGRLIIGEASLKNISGPITIADYAGRSAQAGLAAFVAFLALISVSLGVLNLLPIPLLDGGHLLYYSAEFLTGRPVPESILELGQKLGAILLATLMFLALFNDLYRLLAG